METFNSSLKMLKTLTYKIKTIKEEMIKKGNLYIKLVSFSM